MANVTCFDSRGIVRSQCMPVLQHGSSGTGIDTAEVMHRAAHVYPARHEMCTKNIDFAACCAPSAGTMVQTRTTPRKLHKNTCTYALTEVNGTFPW